MKMTHARETDSEKDSRVCVSFHKLRNLNRKESRPPLRKKCDCGAIFADTHRLGCNSRFYSPRNRSSSRDVVGGSPMGETADTNDNFEQDILKEVKIIYRYSDRDAWINPVILEAIRLTREKCKQDITCCHCKIWDRQLCFECLRNEVIREKLEIKQKTLDDVIKVLRNNDGCGAEYLIEKLEALRG
jgi:hypothetical protein